MPSAKQVFEGAAPGKAILFGEHAVVYGHPAISIPVAQVRTKVRVSTARGHARFVSKQTGLDIRLDEAPSGFWGRRLVAALSEMGGCEITPFLMAIDSTIPVAAGLGSGAALAVAAARALAAFSGKDPGNETINRIAFEVEKSHHGTPSGIDNTTVTYGRPVYFRRGFPIETFRPAASLRILIGLTGVSSPTGAVVADVRTARDREPDRLEGIFNRIGGIAERARIEIEAGNLREVGRLMNENHHWLCEMTVSSPELDRLTGAARAAGALGAKLSGGGRGGNMIALVEPGAETDVEAALAAAGAVRIIRTTVETDGE